MYSLKKNEEQKFKLQDIKNLFLENKNLNDPTETLNGNQSTAKTFTNNLLSILELQ